MLVCESRVNLDLFYLFKKKKVKGLAITDRFQLTVSANTVNDLIRQRCVKEMRPRELWKRLRYCFEKQFYDLPL
uniref:Transposase n=1 Tax=Romanomermis culicivorax TaxID=13658 RepID=A0A915KFI1_ROMCU